MYEAFEFLEAHPQFLHTENNEYGRYYHFTGGHVHVMKEEFWESSRSVVHGSFSTPNEADEARWGDLYRTAEKVAERVRPHVVHWLNDSKFYMPTESPEDWKRGLADPETQWESGFSAKTLAYCWQTANDFPASVRQSLKNSGLPLFEHVDFLIGLPEHKVSLPYGSSASQNDVFVLGKSRHNDSLISITVEGKVEEPFDKTVREWLGTRSERSKKPERFAAICDLLGVDVATVNDIRYQLLHRTASAIIEARRFNAQNALMLVHSFSPTNRSFEDFVKFASLFGLDVTNQGLFDARALGDVQLYIAWVQGEEEFLKK